MTPWAKAKAESSNWLLSQSLWFTHWGRLCLWLTMLTGCFQVQQIWNANTVTQTSFFFCQYWQCFGKEKKNVWAKRSQTFSQLLCSSCFFIRQPSQQQSRCRTVPENVRHHQAINPPSVSLSHQATQGCRFCPMMREILCNSWNLPKRAKSWQKKK